jgi:hypothetical protein
MKLELFHTPILFLIFNRPKTTERVFQQIRKIRPHQLFISADGPRKDKINEEQKCIETRNIIEKIDWNCELKTNYSEKNLGCRVGVSSGINWFFSNVTEGIILEDDCLPDLSFFYFCNTLLEYYKNDNRVMHIGGTNFQDGITRGDGSYYFSSFNHVWGWATWKRAWNLYDVDMKSYPECLRQGLLFQLFPEPAIRSYWKKNFDVVFEKRKDTWDFQWQYASASNHGVSIIPNKNLITNIGFDANATHTVNHAHSLANMPTEAIQDIIHPAAMTIEQKADKYTFGHYLSPPKWKKIWSLIRRIFC